GLGRRSERDLIPRRPRAEGQRLQLDMRKVERAGGGAGVQLHGPRHLGVDLQVELEAPRLEDQEVVAALADRQLAARRVEGDVGLGARVGNVRLEEVGADVRVAGDLDGGSAGVDLEGSALHVPELAGRVERLIGRRVGGHSHVRRGPDDREQYHQSRRDVARNAVQKAPDDQLEADHDQDQRPQIHDLEDAVNADLPDVDEQRDDAGQDQQGRPEEAAVAVRVAHQLVPIDTLSAPPATVTSYLLLAES